MAFRILVDEHINIWETLHHAGFHRIGYFMRFIERHGAVQLNMALRKPVETGPSGAQIMQAQYFRMGQDNLL